jgi:hypothetical protein
MGSVEVYLGGADENLSQVPVLVGVVAVSVQRPHHGEEVVALLDHHPHVLDSSIMLNNKRHFLTNVKGDILLFL